MDSETNKFDVIVIGELNVDLIMNELSAFPSIGKEVLSESMNLTLGSSAAIFANNLSCLGSKVSFVGKMGKDLFADIILQRFRESEVDTSLIMQKKELNTGATVVLNYHNDRAMITHPGAMAKMYFDDIPLQSFQRAKHLHFSSYFLQPGLKENIADLFREAKKAGLTTSFDPQWDPQEQWDLDIENILPHVDIFFPNETELMLITRKTKLEWAIEYIASFPNTTVVKRGTEGSTLLYDGNRITQPALINPGFVDAIGAGDSFNAGFIHQFIQQKSPEVCQQFGNLVGAISTTAPGGTEAFSRSKDVYVIAREKFGHAENDIKK